MALYAKEHNKDSVGNKKIISHSTVIFYKNRNAKMASAYKQNNKTFLFLNKYLANTQIMYRMLDLIA